MAESLNGIVARRLITTTFVIVLSLVIGYLIANA
jgi:hypothetical protein